MADTMSISLAAVTIVSLIIWGAALILGHVTAQGSNDGLSLLKHSITQYTTNGNRCLIGCTYWASFFASTFVLLSLSLIFNDNDNKSVTPLIFLCIFAMSRVLTWCFQPSINNAHERNVETSRHQVAQSKMSELWPNGFSFRRNGSQNNCKGTLYALFTSLSFVALCLSATFLGIVAGSLSGTVLGNNTSALNGLSAATWLFLTLCALSSQISTISLYGLFERLFYVVVICWFGFIAVVLVSQQ